MSARASPWLPPAPPGAVARLLAALAESWAVDWFAGGAACAAAAKGPADEPLRWHGSAEAAVGAGSRQLAALGQALVAGEGDRRNPRDEEILARMGEAAVADLAVALGSAAGAGDRDGQPQPVRPHPRSTMYRLSGPTWSAELALSDAAEVRLRRRAAGSRRSPLLGTFAKALAPAKVRLGCHLGRAELSAADVAGLSRGDLVVLDRATGQPLPLTVEAVPAARGAAALTAEAGIVAARITEAVDLAAGND